MVLSGHIQIHSCPCPPDRRSTPVNESCFADLPGQISTHPVGNALTTQIVGTLGPSLSHSKPFPQVSGFRMELGSTAIAEEVLMTSDFSPPAENLQGRMLCRRFGGPSSVLFKVYCQCELERNVVSDFSIRNFICLCT